MSPNRFVSTHYRILDDKGRVSLPQEYRESLKALTPEGEQCGFWLTGFYGRLVAYLPADWEKIAEQLCKISFRSMALSHFKSKVMGLAQFVTWDGQGRIRIPQPLMREAKLQKEIVMVGMLDKFEIWDQQSFEALDTSSDMSEALASSGLEIPL